MIIKDGLQPSDEWQTDASGRRFRFDGRCVEYEMEVVTSCGAVTEEQLHRMNAREKPAFTYTPPETSKCCPFKAGMQTACDGEACAWWSGKGCAQACPHPAAGRKCPYKHTACTYDCALRSNIE